jgi:hypothetical protein
VRPALVEAVAAPTEAPAPAPTLFLDPGLLERNGVEAPQGVEVPEYVETEVEEGCGTGFCKM